MTSSTHTDGETLMPRRGWRKWSPKSRRSASSNRALTIILRLSRQLTWPVLQTSTWETEGHSMPRRRLPSSRAWPNAWTASNPTINGDDTWKNPEVNYGNDEAAHDLFSPHASRPGAAGTKTSRRGLGVAFQRKGPRCMGEGRQRKVGG